MKIHVNMPLDDLSRLMGPNASTADARDMRVLLASRYAGKDTADIGPDTWKRLLIKVAADRERASVGMVTPDALAAHNARLQLAAMKALERWWPFVHGSFASNAAKSVRTELVDAIDPTGNPDEMLRQMLSQEMKRTELCVSLRSSLADVLTIIERRANLPAMTENEALTLRHAKELVK